jgi:hypothetical protein
MTYLHHLSNKHPRALVSNVYKAVKEKFIKNVISMVRREFYNALQSKFEYEVKETLKHIQSFLLALICWS